MTKEGELDLKERLDRLTFSHLFRQLTRYRFLKPWNFLGSRELQDFGNRLASLPTRWWITPSTQPVMKEAVKLLNDLNSHISSVLMTHTRAIVFESPRANWGIQGQELTVLLAHQAAHHITLYAGTHLDEAYPQRERLGSYRNRWLCGVSACLHEPGDIYLCRPGFKERVRRHRY